MHCTHHCNARNTSLESRLNEVEVLGQILKMADIVMLKAIAPCKMQENIGQLTVVEVAIKYITSFNREVRV